MIYFEKATNSVSISAAVFTVQNDQIKILKSSEIFRNVADKQTMKDGIFSPSEFTMVNNNILMKGR